MLDTAFPRVPGDVGCAATFAFPVRIRRRRGRDARRGRARGRRRAAGSRRSSRPAGRSSTTAASRIATTCGFLARWQDALAAALPVPVLTSALLQVPLVARTLAPGRRVGIVTYSAADLDADVLAGAGVDPARRSPASRPTATSRRRSATARATLDTRRWPPTSSPPPAARRSASRRRRDRARVREHAAVSRRGASACGLPVFDAAQLIAWFHAGRRGHGRSRFVVIIARSASPLPSTVQETSMNRLSPLVAASRSRSPRRPSPRPSGTCRPPIRRTTSTPRTSSSSRTTSTRRPAASSRSSCTRTHRCSRRPRSSAPCRAARRRSARSCSSTSRTRTRSTASTACRSSRRPTPNR